MKIRNSNALQFLCLDMYSGSRDVSYGHSTQASPPSQQDELSLLGLLSNYYNRALRLLSSATTTIPPYNHSANHSAPTTMLPGSVYTSAPVQQPCSRPSYWNSEYD